MTMTGFQKSGKCTQHPFTYHPEWQKQFFFAEMFAFTG